MHLILILGCQRSGTTLLERMFRDDLKSRVFGEFSQLSIDPEKSVWDELPRVADILSGSNATYTVARPLFESDRIVEFLDYFPQSTVVWMFRDVRQVVNSMINKWGDSFFEVSRQRESDANGVWRNEPLINEIQSEAHSTSTVELYATYWYLRNQIALSLPPSHQQRVTFVNYASLVQQPRVIIDRVMKRAGMPGVWRGFRTDAHTGSLQVESTLPSHEELLAKCNATYRALVELESKSLVEGSYS